MGEVVHVNFIDREIGRDRLTGALQRLADAIEAGQVTQEGIELGDVSATFAILVGDDGQFCVQSFGAPMADWARITSIIARATHVCARDPSKNLLEEIAKEQARRNKEH